MKMKKWFFGILFVLATLISCNEDMLDPNSGLDMTLKSTTAIALADGTQIEACGTETVTLWAGQTINAGTVVVSNDAANLYVTINSTAGFQEGTEQIKMWLGTDLGLLDGGGVDRPSAGNFPYKVDLTTETSYTFTIPLQNIPGYNAETCGQQKVYVVVHGDVLAPDGNGGTTTETAWGGDLPGTGTSWWFNNEYIPACCATVFPPTINKNLETAFAKPSIQQGGYVFVTPLLNKKTGLTDLKNNPENYPYLNLTQNRWGWACNLAVAEDILPPTLNYDLTMFHHKQSPFGSDWWQIGTNGVHITNDETNLYVTIDQYLWNTNIKLSTTNVNPLNQYILTVPTAMNPFTATIPLSSIPNFNGCGSLIYFQLTADFAVEHGHYACVAYGGFIPYQTIMPVKGTADYPIYAAAGLNNTANGVQVGTAYVQYNGTTLSVKYDLNEGYEMEEVHVYANDAAPLKVAPGQFEFVQYFDPMVNDFETVFDVPDTNGDGKIWIILHAVVDLNTAQ